MRIVSNPHVFDRHSPLGLGGAWSPKASVSFNHVPLLSSFRLLFSACISQTSALHFNLAWILHFLAEFNKLQ
jgi:hypothetical protein